MTENTWNAIIAATATIFGGVGVKMLQHYHERQKKKEAETHAMRLHNMFIVYNIIEKLIENPKIDRVLLLVGSNGGSVPRPGHEYKVKAIHGVSKNESSDDVTRRYEYIRADAAYMDLLRNLIYNKSKVCFETDKMEPCKLKNFYVSEGVKYSNIYYLGHTADEVFFCSTASFKDTLDSPETQAILDIAIDTMRESFNLYAQKK